ncbi:MAG: hypothetical protein ACRD59_01140 [Candidatus Acidiferrales bacterium]
MSTPTQFSALLLALAVLFGPVAAQELHTTEQWRARFTREGDPVHKARILVSLGDSEFKDAQRALADDKIPQSLEILKEYLGEAQSVEKALSAKIADPEKHPKGFKELQISLRESLRRMDSIIVGLSADDRTPFQGIRGQLDEMDRHLIQQLFPKQPGHTDVKKPGS